MLILIPKETSKKINFNYTENDKEFEIIKKNQTQNNAIMEELRTKMIYRKPIAKWQKSFLVIILKLNRENSPVNRMTIARWIKAML